MIKNIKLLQFFYRRGKLRRQHIPLDENLKDLTSAQTFQRQIKAHRQQFESEIPDLTLTEALHKRNPKLGERFKVDRKEMLKKIRESVKKQLKIERIVPAAQGQQFNTIESKSFLNDQRAEIQFQQKFRQQLFRKRQTNRLLQKEKNDYRNYLQEPKNLQFKKYEQDLNRLKNSKIQSMMNFRRNNQQLRLLIDSGYIDNPENLAIILEKINSTPRLENHQNLYQQSHFIQSKDSNQNHQLQLHEESKKITKISPQIQQMHNKMLQNTQGPSQLRNPQLLQQFFDTFQQSTQLQKQKARQDLNLMKRIKQFQATIFQNRYNTLNFRFKGQVDFTWMKQSELLSYIKTEKNINTQPQGLLTMYAQNKEKQNKFAQPVITPTVMSRIYSICSLYDFPQTDENNRINMLNDKKLVDLQRNLFRNLNQLSDESYADAVFAYARNHKQQQGLLNLKMSSKVLQAIFFELKQRVSSMQEQDMGLVLRSIINTPLMKQENIEWEGLIESISERLPIMEKEYEIESVLAFLTLLPVNERCVQIVSQNVNKMKDYKWDAKETLQCFLQCSAFIIRHKGYFSVPRGSKMIQQLKYTFASKYQQIMSITQKLSINSMPQLLSVMYYFDKSKQSQAKYEIQIPNKLINKCKKEIIDNVRMQKQLIKKYTLGGVLMSMSMIDYCKELTKKSDGQQVEMNVMEMSIQKSLFCFRPLPFNSINYFTYHQLAKVVSNEIPHLPVKSIVQSLFAVSLVRYKNQGIIEDIMSKIVQKIHHEIKESKQPQNITHLKYSKQYMLLVCCFHHTRMVNPYYLHFVEILKHVPLAVYAKFQPNLLIRFFQSLVTLSFSTKQNHEQQFSITKHFSKIFQLCYSQTIKSCLSVLSKHQLLVLNFTQQMFKFFSIKNNQTVQKMEQQQNEVLKQLQKFKSKFTIQEKYLYELTNVVNKMSRTLLSVPNQNQIQQKKLLSSEFQTVEFKYYQHFIPVIMDQQQQIGSQFKYEIVYQNVRKKLLQKYSQNQINPKTWRIQVPHKREVYFITTYEHLYAKHQDENTTVKLFGFWKIYEEYYALNGWTFKYVCSFLEG